MPDQQDEELIGMEVKKVTAIDVEGAPQEHSTNPNLLIIVGILFYFLGFYYGRSLWH
jgi:hypothetical protein